MAATGKEKLYVVEDGGGRVTVSAQEVADLAASGGTVTWDDVSGKPAVIAAGTDAAAARTAIGLGALATLNTVSSAQIADSTIVNADVSASAAIARTKLAAHGVTAETTANAANTGDWTADGAAVVALVNALKAKLNALIAAV